MKIQKVEKPFKIAENERCKVKTSGNITEIMAFTKKSSGAVIRKIDKDRYIDTRDGEIKEFKHQDSRADNLKQVSQSLALGRDLINTNVTDVKKCRWITLTYAENMTDPERLKRDFDAYNKKCRRKYGHYEYITAAEPQGRGAWHLHVIQIFEGKAPYMPNYEVAALWGQGFVTIKKLDDVDNVGAYLTAYLGDIDLDEARQNEINTSDKCHIKNVEYNDKGSKKSKAVVKGGRLGLYPPQMHIFRWSKGIKKPDIEYMTYGNAKEKVSGATLTFKKSVKLNDEDTGFENELRYEYYNSVRAKSQEYIDCYIPVE